MADLESFAAWMEKALRQDIEALQADTVPLGGVRLWSQTLRILLPLQTLQEYCKAKDKQID